MTVKHILIGIIVLLLFCIPVIAETSAQGSPYTGTKAEFFYPDTVVSHIYHANIQPHWIGNDSFWYKDNGKDSTDYILVNIPEQNKKLIFDSSRLAGALTNATGKKVDKNNLSISSEEIAADMGIISFNGYGDEWNCDLSVYKLTRNSIPEQVRNGVRSPDNKYIAYISGNNLNLYDIATRSSISLTNDGTDDYFYARRSDTVRDPVTEERLNQSSQPYLVWSSDSSRIQTFRVDQRDVNSLYLVQNVPQNGSIRPILYSYRYAYPGDDHIPLYEPITIDIQSKTVTSMQYKPQPETTMMDTDQDVLQWWNPSGNSIYTLFLERGEKTLRFLIEDPKTGSVREVINETGPTYRESNLKYADKPNVAVIERTGDIIWFSERDGWGHLYLYDNNGNLKNQITSGPWVVRKILKIDEENSLIYFTASGIEPRSDPYYQYLYRIQFDGSNLQLITPETADHQISFSPDGTKFVDSYSRVDLPPATDLKNADGSFIMHIASADISDLTNSGWNYPERVTFKARDGVTDLFGILFKPTNFDQNKKYPVIDVVYPGPYTTVTTTKFPSDTDWNSKIFWTSQMLSELGYIVVNMDGLGTAYRSKAFHDVSYGNLSDGGLPDHISGIKELANRNRFMDISKVGIYGKSAGGFMAAQAMLTYPEFFKTGVAASGNMDSRLYGSFWGEKYEGIPGGSNYQEQITSAKAGNLTGKLLLLTGDMDDNVHPSMTMQVADALINAGKDFDMFEFTNQNHDLNYEPYYLRKMMNFFVQNL